MARFQASVSLVLLSCLCAAGAIAGPKRFEVTVLPDLQTPFGAFPMVEGRALNNRGEVAGQACGAVRPTESGCAAFRLRSGVMEDLDPDGRYRSTAIAINKRGVVLGELGFGADRRFFKTSRNGTVEFLDRGLPRSESGRPIGIFVRSFTDRGLVVADVTLKGRSEPFLWSDAVGAWEPLTAGEPEFAGDLRFHGINDRREAVLVTAGEGGSAAYLYRRDRSIIVIRPMAQGIVTLTPPTRAGAVSGRVFENDSDKAIYFDRARGLRSIHPEGFRHSYALQTLEDGTALVAATRGRLEGPTIFYFTYHPRAGLKPLWTEEQIRDLRERAGCGKPNRNDFFPPRMNRRGESIATLYCIGGRGGVHFSRETGFTLLREVLAEQGFDDGAAEGRGINDRGQLLVSSLIDNWNRPVVLTPAR